MIPDLEISMTTHKQALIESDKGLLVDEATMPKSSKPRVSFKDVEIRKYPIILGDNPACSSGVPVTIDWTHDEGRIQKIEDYENSHAPRKDIFEMYLSAKARIQMLNDDYSKEEMKQVYLDIAKIQRQRKRTVVTLDTPFIDAATGVLWSTKNKLLQLSRRLLMRKH